MKNLINLAVLIPCLMLLQACGKKGLADSSSPDTDTIRPTAPNEDYLARPKPPANAKVITATGRLIKDADGKELLLRGANILLQTNALDRIKNIDALAETDANFVRLQIDENTDPKALDAALDIALKHNMKAMVTLTAPVGKLECTESNQYLFKAVDDLWLNKFMAILVQDRYQPILMLNIAKGWGIKGVLDAYSLAYQEYIDTYKALIGKFRKVGFKVPLVIDAPNCSSDFNAFLQNRGQELLLADTAKNLIFSMDIQGKAWGNPADMFTAATLLERQEVPFIFGNFNGAEYIEYPIDHLDVMAKTSGDSALNINLKWASTDDKAGFLHSLEKALDLRGGAKVKFQYFIDTPYLDIKNESGQIKQMGKLTTNIYVQDIDGNRLALKKIPASDTSVITRDKWAEITAEIPQDQLAIKPEDLMLGAATFDLTRVTGVGIAFLANGKPINQAGDIRIDDLSILPGVPPMYKEAFASSLADWSVIWDKPAKAEWDASGGLKITPTGNEIVIGLPASGANAKKIDWSKKLEITIGITLPKAYESDTSLYFKTFTQLGAAYDWADSNAIGSSNFKFGEKTNVTFTVDYGLNGKKLPDTSIGQMFGLQLGNITQTAPIFVDEIKIIDPAAKTTKTITGQQTKLTFADGTEGFFANFESGDNWKGVIKTEVTATDGTLQIKPLETAGDNSYIGFETRTASTLTPIKVENGLKIKAQIWLPEGGTSLKPKVYIQDGKSWTWYETAEIALTNLKAGEWNNIEFEVSNLPAGYQAANPNVLGFVFSGVKALNGAAFKLDNIVAEGNVTVETSDPIFIQHFNNQAAIENMKPDYAAGGLTQEALATTKTLGWRMVPTGWAASAWKGNSKAQVDLSSSESKLELTEYGDDIVNDIFGIRATVQPPPTKQ